MTQKFLNPQSGHVDMQMTVYPKYQLDTTTGANGEAPRRGFIAIGPGQANRDIQHFGIAYRANIQESSQRLVDTH